MALADTSKAIGAVTEVLKERLDARTGKQVSVGRVDQGSSFTDGYLNLYLYEIAFDPNLKNTPLNEKEKPPIWLVLKYLVTAFETTTNSDSAKAHELLGSAIRAICQDDLLKLGGLVANTDALESNPSELHVSFDEAPADLVAKLTQGADQTPRLSIAFQVRPVMIAAAEPGSYSLLVGIDYSKPPVALAAAPVGLDVIPSMGAFISAISPTGFEIGETITLRGTDLHLANLSVMLGSVELPITMQRPDEIEFMVDPGLVGAAGISAGSHAVTVAQTLLGTGKKRKSNAVIGNLAPTITGALIPNPGPTIIPGSPPAFPERAHAIIEISGLLLGDADDDVLLALYGGGKVHKVFDVFSPSPGQPQTALRLEMKAEEAVPTGDYNLILMVNGQQAPQSPLIRMRGP